MSEQFNVNIECWDSVVADNDMEQHNNEHLDKLRQERDNMMSFFSQFVLELVFISW